MPVSLFVHTVDANFSFRSVRQTRNNLQKKAQLEHISEFDLIDAMHVHGEVEQLAMKPGESITKPSLQVTHMPRQGNKITQQYYYIRAILKKKKKKKKLYMLAEVALLEIPPSPCCLGKPRFCQLSLRISG